jgi:hypothetical protein
MRRPLSLLIFFVVACDPGPAQLLLDGVGPAGGPYTKDVRVVPDEPTAFEGRFVNEGGAADAPSLSFADLACMTIEHDFAADRVEPGADLVFPLTVTASTECRVQTIVDWFVDCADGSSRGTFNVVLDP